MKRPLLVRLAHGISSALLLTLLFGVGLRCWFGVDAVRSGLTRATMTEAVTIRTQIPGRGFQPMALLHREPNSPPSGPAQKCWYGEASEMAGRSSLQAGGTIL